MIYTNLILSKAKYDDLTNDGVIRRKNVIVFQFTYLLQSSNYPTLKAYAMKFKHQDIPDAMPVNLDYAITPPTTDLAESGEQVIGDLQIEYGDIEQLKKDSNPGHKENYDFLLFTPKFDTTNHHIYFDVSVVPSTHIDIILTITKSLNPSPPSGAK